MRKILFAFLVVTLLLLDFAALDDITTSIQPHYLFEYSILVLSAVIFCVFGYFFLKAKRVGH